MNKLYVVSTLFLLSTGVISCGGGGGSSGGVETVDGAQWKINAAVSSDGCSERISPVTQTFTINQSGSQVVVDTSIVSMSGTTTDDGFVAGFAEANGDCSRSYEIQFSNMSSSIADVKLNSSSECLSQTCQNEWSGTATKIN